MKGGRDAVEGEGAEQVEQNRSFSFSLSLSFTLFLAALAHLIYPTIMG